MLKPAKILFALSIVGFSSFASYVDKGVGAKKDRISLNISLNKGFTSNLTFNLSSGLKYKGTLLSNSVKPLVGTVQNRSIIYEKGNTVYIVPFKSKIISQEVSPAYNGIKVTLKVP